MCVLPRDAYHQNLSGMLLDIESTKLYLVGNPKETHFHRVRALLFTVSFAMTVAVPLS